MKKLIASLALSIMILPGLSLAQPQLIELSSQLSFTPNTASVMFMNKQGTKEIPNAKLRNVAGNVFAAVIEIPEQQLKGDIFVSALFAGNDGKFAMSDVTKVTRDSGQSYLSLPTCDLAQDAVIDASTAGQAGLLESLEGIRLARRNLLRKNLEELLDANLQTKLQNIERGFGLHTASTPVNANMAPFEILKRLERVRHSVATYKQSKGAE